MKILLFVLIITLISCSDSTSSVTENSNSIVISSVVASPTIGESIELLNSSNNTIDISGYILMDRSAATFKIDDSTFIEPDQTILFTKDDLYFSINDTNEVIYLLDREVNKIDIWRN